MEYPDEEGSASVRPDSLGADAAAGAPARLRASAAPALAALRAAIECGDHSAALHACRALRALSLRAGAVRLGELLMTHEGELDRGGAVLRMADWHRIHAMLQSSGAGQGAAPSRAPAARPRVLVADDNELMRRLMTIQLSKLGGDVVAVEDGAAAVVAGGRECFDLMFLDFLMPVMDGAEAARQIRVLESELGRRATPIIGMSAHLEPDLIGQARRHGMDDFIRKPLAPADLAERFEYWIARACAVQ